MRKSETAEEKKTDRGSNRFLLYMQKKSWKSLSICLVWVIDSKHLSQTTYFFLFSKFCLLKCNKFNIFQLSVIICIVLSMHLYVQNICVFHFYSCSTSFFHFLHVSCYLFSGIHRTLFLIPARECHYGHGTEELLFPLLSASGNPAHPHLSAPHLPHTRGFRQFTNPGTQGGLLASFWLHHLRAYRTCRKVIFLVQSTLCAIGFHL